MSFTKGIGETIVVGGISVASSPGPDRPRTTYGRGDVRIVQAEMSHLKAIRVALKDPPDKPDLVTMLAAVGTAGLVVHKFVYLDPITKAWRLPGDTLELWVISFAVASGLGAFLKFVKAFKPKRSTHLAIEHLDELYTQHGIQEPGMAWWQTLGDFFWKIL